jgi:prevent-host-death family protein
VLTVIRLDVTEVRENFSETVSRAAYGQARILVSRRGRPVVGIVPVADLERLEGEHGVGARPAVADDATS